MIFLNGVIIFIMIILIAMIILIGVGRRDSNRNRKKIKLVKDRCNSLYSALFTEIEILESDLNELEFLLDKIKDTGCRNYLLEGEEEEDIYEEFMTEKITLEYGEGMN